MSRSYTELISQDTKCSLTRTLRSVALLRALNSRTWLSTLSHNLFNSLQALPHQQERASTSTPLPQLRRKAWTHLEAAGQRPDRSGIVLPILRRENQPRTTAQLSNWQPNGERTEEVVCRRASCYRFYRRALMLTWRDAFGRVRLNKNPGVIEHSCRSTSS